MVERSHDSRIYDTRVMLRLDAASGAKLQQLISHFGASKADIIRHLLVQATPEDFPPSWQLRAAECRARRSPHPQVGDDQESHL
jgi:hypothetical protein